MAHGAIRGPLSAKLRRPWFRATLVLQLRSLRADTCQVSGRPEPMTTATYRLLLGALLLLNVVGVLTAHRRGDARQILVLLVAGFLFAFFAGRLDSTRWWSRRLESYAFGRFIKSLEHMIDARQRRRAQAERHN